MASYTAALTSDSAVPAWHDGYPEMPFVFVGSGATAAAGLGLLAAPVSQNGPSRAMAVFGVGTELAASNWTVASSYILPTGCDGELDRRRALTGARTEQERQSSWAAASRRRVRVQNVI